VVVLQRSPLQRRDNAVEVRLLNQLFSALTISWLTRGT